MSVSINPGAMQLTRMLRLAYSFATTFGEADQPRLAGRIIGLTLVAGQADDAAHVDDATGSPLHHSLEDRAGGVERPFQVGVEHRIPVLLGQPEENVVAGEPGIVHQNIHRAQGGFGGGHRRHHLILLSNVTGYTDGSNTQRRRHLPCPRGIAPHHGDLGACSVESLARWPGLCHGYCR